MKRIAIIGTAGIPAKYGGFETLTHHLAKHLKDDYELTVYCSKHFYKKSDRMKKCEGAKLVYIPFNANGVQSIIYDIVSMIHAMFKSDILLVLGVSGGLFFPFVNLFSNRKLIVNIDGLEWRRAKWGKWASTFLKISEWVAVKFSHAFITDNKALQAYAEERYNLTNQLIAYGGDHVKPVSMVTEDKRDYPFLSKPYAFKVARIEPENNIHMVLEAFAELPQKPLVLVGNWDASIYGSELREAYKKYDNLMLLDPIYDQRTLDVLRTNCAVYIHGHSAGGTNPSLVEAMTLGLPIIAYDVNFNRESTEDQAMFFSDAKALAKMLNNTPIRFLKQKGLQMRELAIRKYRWEVIARQYQNIFEAFAFKYRKKDLQTSFGNIKSNDLQALGMSHLNASKLNKR